MGHAGEILQGAIRIDGTEEPFLITLPAPCLRSEASIEQAESWTVDPPWKTKALGAAQLAARIWRWPHCARLDIRSVIPVARGYGSSTADCSAAIRALADLAGRELADEEVAAIAGCAEGASDPTMFGLRPVAFLPRRGKCLSYFDGGWPGLHVSITDLGGPPVDTLATPRPSYKAAELDEFADLLKLAESAFAARDASALAHVALRSAAIHQRHRPHPSWSQFRRDAEAAGAIGIALAHSGTAAAMLSKSPLMGTSKFEYSLPGSWKGSHVDCASGRR